MNRSNPPLPFGRQRYARIAFARLTDILRENSPLGVIPMATSRFNAYQALLLYHKNRQNASSLLPSFRRIFGCFYGYNLLQLYKIGRFFLKKARNKSTFLLFFVILPLFSLLF